MVIAAAVFDFDGVIVDSVEIKGDAFADVYANHGDQIVEEVRAYHLAHGGRSRWHKLEYYERVLLGRAPTDDELATKAEAFARAVVDRVVAAEEIPGALSLIEELRRQIPVYVSSGTPHEELVEIVARRGYTDRFNDAFGSPATKAGNLRTIAERMAVTTDELVMVGDSMTDLEGAREAGSQFVGFATAGESFPADTLVVRSHDELRRWFAEQLPRAEQL